MKYRQKNSRNGKDRHDAKGIGKGCSSNTLKNYDSGFSQKAGRTTFL